MARLCITGGAAQKQKNRELVNESGFRDCTLPHKGETLFTVLRKRYIFERDQKRTTTRKKALPDEDQKLVPILRAATLQFHIQKIEKWKKA